MKGNKYKASLILGVVSAGFLISYPLQHTFMGGVLTSGFKAAMVGGLADWFAVSALFRRPLGIPFRTAIIPRNRERIFRALIDMVEQEILIKENIKAHLNHYNLANLLVYFMVERRGKSYLKKILYRFLQDMFSQIKAEELASMMNHILQHGKEKIKVSSYVITMLEWLIHNRYHERIINVIIDQIIVVAKQKELQSLLAEIFIDVRENYERGMNRRRFFNNLMNLSPMQVASGAQEALLAILSEIKNTDHTVRQQANLWLNEFLLKLKTKENLQQEMEEWLQEKIVYQFHFEQDAAQGIIDLYGKEAKDQKNMLRWLTPIIDQIDKWILDFAADEEEKAKLDSYLKIAISDWIETHHDKIGMIVKDSLNEFTNERLVNFIESKVSNDLQMIRINGSVVGGLVGIAIHLLTFWL